MASAPSVEPPLLHSSGDRPSASAPVSSLPYQSPNASALTSGPSSSRAISPSDDLPLRQTLTVGTGPPRSLVLSSSVTPNGRGVEDSKGLIIRSFVPHIAVCASQDTDLIVRQKGFEDGFLQLLRPFGEVVQGKVTVRDSNGASRSFEDFGVRFIKLGNEREDRRNGDGQGGDLDQQETNGLPIADKQAASAEAPKLFMDGGDIGQIEELVGRHLSVAESIHSNTVTEAGIISSPNTSPFFSLYIRRLLSSLPLTPHETFSHPVACIVAISSRNPSPIEALRQLYDRTSRGNLRLPDWVNSDYLRYYVLIHDEEKDDIAKSTALFEQMKRHFGLHCHLLRLRSTQCLPTDDDSVRFPDCEWISAAEELGDIRIQGTDEAAQSVHYLYESDLTALKTFVRELVTQSLVPFMERCVATWNDQVASRRRGISGRLMTLSKKWTGFSSQSRNGSGGLGLTSSGSSNGFDPAQGFYRADTAEATMRKLGDYAFMLRDWKLAQSTYDLLRPDFNSDKAWKYYAGANEMAAISMLLVPQPLTAKVRWETIDQMLDNASYSYLSRCADSYCALRCLAVGAELLKGRGGSAAEDAATWDTRILEMNLLGPIGQALFTQRVAACYAVRKGAGSKGWGARPRKAALWNILAANAWLELGLFAQADKCLQQASAVYDSSPREDGLSSFGDIQTFVGGMTRVLGMRASAGNNASQGMSGSQVAALKWVDEESEQLDHQARRKSVLTAGSPLSTALDGNDLKLSINEDKSWHDKFN